MINEFFSSLLNTFTSILPIILIIMPLFYLIKNIKSILNWEELYSSNQIKNDNKKTLIQKEEKEKRRIQLLEYDNKLDKIQEIISNKYNELTTDLFLLSKSQKLYKDSIYLKKILKNKKNNNITFLTKDIL